MGFIRRIGRAMSRTFRRVGKMAMGAVKLAAAPFTAATSLATGILSKGLGLLAKSPFGQLAGGLISKFMSSPLAMLATGPLAMMSMLLGSAFGKGKASETLQDMNRQNGGIQNMPPQAYQNTINITAQAQANYICH